MSGKQAVPPSNKAIIDYLIGQNQGTLKKGTTIGTLCTFCADKDKTCKVSDKVETKKIRGHDLVILHQHGLSKQQIEDAKKAVSKQAENPKPVSKSTVQQPETSVEDLKKENARLKAELAKAKAPVKTQAKAQAHVKAPVKTPASKKKGKEDKLEKTIVNAVLAALAATKKR